MRIRYGCGKNDRPFPPILTYCYTAVLHSAATLLDLIERGFLWITRPFLPCSLYATINGVSRATLEDVVCIEFDFPLAV